MTPSNRAAERDKFTHQRAELMFARHLAAKRLPDEPWAAYVHEGTEPQPGEAATLQEPGRAERM